MRLVVTKPLIPSNSVIEDEAEREAYWNIFLKAWGSTRTSFPGCNPRSLNRADLQNTLTTGDYRICLKSDGVRYALFLTTRPGDPDAAVALMVNRAGAMYEIEVIAPEECFRKNSILEGELVWKQPGETDMMFLVFDMVCLRGESLLGTPFAERMERATRLTRCSEEIAALDPATAMQRAVEADAIVVTHYDPAITIRPKCFVAREHAAKLWKGRAEAEHYVDGIMLHDTRSRYTMGTANNGAVLKWKEHVSVDLRGTPDALHAADAPLPTTIHGRVVTVVESRVSAASAESVLEYNVRVTADRVHLLATRTRPDKTTANGLRVVLATIADAIEDVRPEDIGLTSELVPPEVTNPAADGTVV